MQSQRDRSIDQVVVLPFNAALASQSPEAFIQDVLVHGLGARDLEELIYRRSGLLGVSGLSQDMRRLRAAATPEAAEAIALYVYRILREVGSLAAALGGLDGIVFTAGIGENDAATRAAVCGGSRWLGLALDRERNRTGGPRISAEGSAVSAWVIPTDEERMIARHTLRVTGLA